MPTYKLTYFNITARAEAPRMLFRLAGQDFEDVRLTGDQWKERKQNTPFGQLPLLEVDGKVMCQSYAISRYLAREFGFCSDNAWENARMDMIVDCLEDFFKKGRPVFFEEDAEKKAAGVKAFQENDMPENLARFDKMLADNGTGFFVGSKVSWTDIVFITMLPLIMGRLGLTVDEAKYPNITAHKKKIDEIPAIAKWYKDRPETPF